MGVNTKAILRKDTTLEQIYLKLKDKYSDVQIHNTSASDFFIITFQDGLDNRRLSVFFNDYAKNDYGLEGTLCDLNLWGNSIEIMKYLLDEFGGYLDENDCDEDDFYPVNLDSYKKGSELSAEESFKLKIIQKLGYKNLNAALELFKEYSSIFTF